VNELAQAIKTANDVRAVLARRASFDELLLCARVARELGDLELRSVVAERALDEARKQSRPEPRAAHELKMAARLVASAVIARASSLGDLPDRLNEARGLLGSRGVNAENTKASDAVSTIDGELADLLLYLSDGSPRSLVSAGALLRRETADGPDLAIVAVERVLQEEPKNAAALTIRGAALTDLGMFGEAVGILRSGVKLHPNNSHMLVAYSRALEASGRIEDALRAARKASEQAPEDQYAVMRWLKAARAAGHDKEFAHVLEEVKNLAPRTPTRDQWVELLAIEVLLDSGERESAWRAFKALGAPSGKNNRKLYQQLNQKLR
jgi:tetratricopeptide (TPR) repeat protein